MLLTKVCIAILYSGSNSIRAAVERKVIVLLPFLILHISKMFVLVVLFAACSNPIRNSHQIVLTGIEDLKQLRAIPFQDLKGTTLLYKGKRLTGRDIIMEDEGVEWKAVEYYYGTECLFTAESSWLYKDSIMRMTTTSSLLKTTAHMGVDTRFGELKTVIDFHSQVEFPDGYVMFKDSRKPWLVYDMIVDTSRHDLLEGPFTKSDIPDSIRVGAVIVD